jgi:hypothetical protein
MNVIQASIKIGESWKYLSPKKTLKNPLVLVFANRMLLEHNDVVDEIRKEFPYQHIVFGSTSGEIIGAKVFDESIVVTAIEFEKSTFQIRTENVLNHNKDSKKMGAILYDKMPKENLKHLFVISEGSFVNGSSLIEGLEENIQNSVPISGGMCGDDAKFEKTLASYNEYPKEGEVVLIGFYGETLEISFSSYGGWTTFGPARTITKSKANVLYEIDGLPALDLYKKYLGEKANKLPQASLLYPLNITLDGRDQAVVRTILGIDNENSSMTLAGDVPVNARVQLMMASVDGIVQGAKTAAVLAMKGRKQKPEIAILVSCVGRKLVMNQRVEEEIEEVNNIVGKDVSITGFYSYGEMAPFTGNTFCDLHNQTMTLTLISE